MVCLKQFLQVGCMLAVANADCTVNQQPVVDLGYGIYRATGLNNSSDSYYSFSNIRYAAAPVGDLRWKAAMPPQSNRSAIQSNSESITCAQGTPTWQLRTSQHTNDYLKTGNVPNVSYSDMSTISAGGVEDCLFLDVQVPRKIFDRPREDGKLAPVLVWIHGGGFTSGSKTNFGSPKGLIDRSQASGSDGVVYVSLNYRLGAFGFLSGPSFQAEEGMLNAGLHDQRFALQWIQDNIHLFGGDKRRVTVFGESGGGGSIMHHVTAYGGRAPALFNQAVPQSPAYFPYRSLQDREKAFSEFLDQANVTSLAEARNLSADVLIWANAKTIGVSQPYTASTIYGPTPDGSLVREDPKVLLRRGEFDQSVKMLTSHNSDEGLILVPAVHTDEEYETLIKRILTRANDSTIEYITKTLYPPVFDGSMGYTNNYQRAALTAGDVIVNCNAAALESAYRIDSHAYLFDVYPGVHAQDTGYTFYTPNQKASSYSLIDTGAVNQTIAFAIQDFILSLAKDNILSSPVDGLPPIPTLGSWAKTVLLNGDNITVSHDPAANRRCQWWSLDLFD